MTTRPEPTYGPTEPVDTLVTVVRYGDVTEIKRRLGLQTSDTAWDTAIIQGAVAGEVKLDQRNGGAYASGSVPVFMKQASENVAVAVLKSLDAPWGTAGSADFSLGDLQLDDEVTKELRRNPLVWGEAIQFGFSGGTQSPEASP